MHKLLLLLFTSFFVFHDTSDGQFSLTFYDQNNKAVLLLNESDFKTIDWKNQCYEIRNKEKLNNTNFKEGRADFSFNKQILLSVDLVEMSGSQAMPEKLPLLFTRDGLILSSRDRFCISAFNDQQRGLMNTYTSNDGLTAYLKHKGLLFNY